MRIALAVLACLGLSAGGAASVPEFPLRAGEYEFRLADAEFDGRMSSPARVTIQGSRIAVVVTACGGPFPCNSVIAEGAILWHESSGQWIIAESEEDFSAEEVGGCSAGPMTIDPKRRIIWYC